MCKTEASSVPATLCFAPLDAKAYSRASAVCLGTGRFLRAVLVPALAELGEEVVLAQTRGTSFGRYMAERPDRTYEVDTVQQDGEVLTSAVPVAACGTLGTPEGRGAFMALPAKLPLLRFVGLGLTEAGIVHNGGSILDLAEFLHGCFVAGLCSEHPLSMINTDNMPFNGNAIRRFVHGCDFTLGAPRSEEFRRWMDECVVFHNTMVDRITSHRSGAADVPRAEPLPAKALVIEDLASVLPERLGSVPGMVVRSEPNQLELDIALKLRIANALHTAMVYTMSLGRIFQTDGCIGHPDILHYLEQLFRKDIIHSCKELAMPREKAEPAFREWMTRLQHPHFGLGCLFVCQNATQKVGIRLLPSIKATLAAGETPSEFMAFALAVVLRFLTPRGEQPRLDETPPVFIGWLDLAEEGCARAAAEDWEYTSGLRARPADGTYEFRDGDGRVPLLLRLLAREGGCSVQEVARVAAEALALLEGFQPQQVPEHGKLAAAVGVMLHKMLHGTPAMRLLAGLRAQAESLPQVGRAVLSESEVEHDTAAAASS